MSYDRALQKAMRYCMYQERCLYDMEKRFAAWNVKKEEWDKIIDCLIDQNFLSEERFVSAYVRGKFNQSKWGVHKIKIGLQQKHISPKLIEWGLKEIDEDLYRNELTRLLEVKRERLKGRPAEMKDKLWRYARQKGYESHLISEIVNEMLRN